MQEDDYGSLDPYHVNRIGWSKPQVYASSDYKLGDTVTLRLSDFQSSGQNIILANKWNEANSLYDEYLILEMFAPTGLNFFDAQIRFRNTIQSGIRVWHVNSVLTKFYDENKTSAIVDGESYLLAYNNHNVSSECDVLHMIRNNPNEAYHTTSKIQNGEVLFEQGDSFDMETFQSQFINGSKLDNGEKLGWAFTVDAIYRKADGTIETAVKRVRRKGTDLTRVDAVNAVSRRMEAEKLSCEEVMALLKEIETRPAKLTQMQLILAVAMSSAGWAIMFGGRVMDAVISFFVAFLSQILAFQLDKAGMRSFVSTLMGSLIGTLLPMIFNHFTGLLMVEASVAACLMPMLPGLAMTNAVQDTLRGDMVSGISSATSAVLTASMIAGGALVGSSIFKLLTGGALL